MRLKDLIQAITPIEVSEGSDQEIRGLSYDSRIVEPGDLFFALKGTSSDGHQFIDIAIENGASAIVIENPVYQRIDLPWVLVKDARLAMAKMAACFYGDPSADIPLIGVTGTNGKTTTTYIIEGILASAGIRPAVLGTINYRLGDMLFPAPHTTPESVDLQGVLRKLVNEGAKAAVMEVSSHALEQRRVDGCRFDVGVFTNLTRDHLDYHGDMESYKSAKSRLFNELLLPDSKKAMRYAVINSDDPAGAEIAESSVVPVITYGLGADARVTAAYARYSVKGVKGEIRTPAGSFEFRSSLLGRFNLYNILGAVAVGVVMDIPLEKIKEGIENHPTVPGRLERVPNDEGITVLVDYAHTGDALENALLTLGEIKGGRMITVFGCGGDRDRGKRPIMGEIAGRYSDLAIVTSDNPRTEDALSIILEIRAGMVPLNIEEYPADELTDGFKAKGFVIVPDRRAAIGMAIRMARPGDIVVVAGKGHEDYQIVGTTKHHFDDREEVRAAFEELKQ